MNTLSSGYKPFCQSWWNHWFSPKTYYRWLKYKIQRGNRGWADCDTWSLDDYLSEWLPDAITHLKKHTHGHPDQLTQEAWAEILDKIAEGFRGYRRASEGLYEEELGPFPLHELNDMYKPNFLCEQRINKTTEFEKRDMKLFDEGMTLFVKHFGDLWD